VIGESASILITIDDGEIRQAQQAPAVALAPRMLDDHTTHRALTLEVLASYQAAKRPNVVSAQLERETTQALADLGAAADPAYEYLRLQVVMQYEALVIVDALRDHAPGPNFDAFLADTRTTIDAHRVMAEHDLRND